MDRLYSDNAVKGRNHRDCGIVDGQLCTVGGGPHYGYAEHTLTSGDVGYSLIKMSDIHLINHLRVLGLSLAFVQMGQKEMSRE